jgi:hypothetical protein
VNPNRSASKSRWLPFHSDAIVCDEWFGKTDDACRMPAEWSQGQIIGRDASVVVEGGFLELCLLLCVRKVLKLRDYAGENPGSIS